MNAVSLYLDADCYCVIEGIHLFLKITFDAVVCVFTYHN